jgi:NTP pyrophosphatase (non-canonical NTP hydrolase)
VVEECAELIVAVRHMQRGRNTVNQLADEIADVQIMLDQAALLVGPAIVEKHRKAKLERLERRIVEGERGRGRP